jgi:alkylation response protein AidB-like acyl-CoA dehydrogenase
MDLSLDEDRGLLQKTLRDFSKETLRPRSRDWDEAAAIDPDTLSEGWGLGLVAAGIGDRFGGALEGGAAPSALTGVISLEELAAGDLAYAQRLLAPNHVAVPVSLFGTEVEKEELLPLFTKNDLPLASAAWIEPARTFDLAAVRTRAQDTTNGAELFGQKALVPAGDQSELLVVYARNTPAAGFEGVGAYLVRGRSASGLSRKFREEPIGPRAAPLFRLELEQCEARRLGATGVHYRRLVERSLVASAAAAVGVARAAAEYAMEYGKERVAFGRPIAQNQSIAFMIADAYTAVDSARLMTWRAANKIDQGAEALREAHLAFRFATDAAFRIADDGVQILGGHGVIRDHLAELYFRNARSLAVAPGWFMV